MTLEYPNSPILSIEEENEIVVVNPKLSVEEVSDDYGRFVVGPLDPGYGVTLGNPLRRVLYNSLYGAAVTWVKIEGVLHEYSNIDNIKEEVSQILLNIKNIRIRCEIDNPGTMNLNFSGSGQITGSDISVPAGMSIVNPDIHIATSNSDDVNLQIEMNVEKGKGYKVADSGEGFPIGVIQIDSIFTPVRKVNYSVSQTRVGNKADYEELHLEVWTDGSVFPAEAVIESANLLVNQFFLFTKADDVQEGSEGVTMDIPAEHYNLTVEELDLSSRTLNCLKRAGLNKVGEVIEKSKEELLSIRNFGEKSYNELYDKFREMDILPDSSSNFIGGSEEISEE